MSQREWWLPGILHGFLLNIVRKPFFPIQNDFVPGVVLGYALPFVNSALLRTLVIYAIILPLAVLLGWLAVDLADLDRTSFTVFATIIFVLLLPVLLKWYYPVLIFSWSAFVTLFFLPGRPTLWMLMVLITVSIAILQRIILKRPTFVSAPTITFSLLLLGTVILITAWVRGGIGLNILGSFVVGGKAYIQLLLGIVGYFAIASQPIPMEKAGLYVGLFFLSALMSVASNLIYYAGPAFYFLYLIFPAGFAGVQATSEMYGTISRVAGFSTGGVAVCFFMFAIYGIRGLFAKWWRLLLIGIVLIFGTMGGYRSLVVLIGLVFLILFVAEGLLRSRLFPALIFSGVLVFVSLVPLTPSLPLSIQRTLSILPLLDVNPMVRSEATSSLEWRWQIWRALVPDLPKYFWLGKGYALNPTDLYLAEQAMLRGRVAIHEVALQSGSYHSGPLTLYVPFGAPGCLAFLIFIGIALRALYQNFRYGDEQLRTINRFIFACFLGRIIFFLTAFGDFSGDLYSFTGTVGLSIALNKGVRRRPAPISRSVLFRAELSGNTAQPKAVLNMRPSRVV